MKLAILFWFYKEPEICENRLKLIKKFNPDLKIFGLFGGMVEEADMYKEKLGQYLDDFYISPSNDPDWKWIHGDLMILDWFEKSGHDLAWDSIAVVQWDMLVLDSLLRCLEGIKEGEILLSGSRTLDEFIEDRWNWTREGSVERENYLHFINYVKQHYEYSEPLVCCLFIFTVFPRTFFEKYLTVANREIGMLEYKIPTYAKIFNIPMNEKNLGVWWFDEKAKRGETPMNARGVEIGEGLIQAELQKKNGFRIFHPYFKIWPID